MAKYKKRADGRKEGTIKIDGKRYHVYGYTDAEINRQKEALLAAAHDGSLYIDKVTTFEEWALRWQGIRPNLETKTVEMYEWAVNKLIPLLGSRPIADIKPSDIQIALNAYDGHARTQQILLLTMSQIFTAAVNDELIIKNPCDKVPKVNYKAPEKRPLTDIEKKAVMTAELDLPERAYISILYYCGLRRGECLALSVHDIDRKKWMLNVKNALVFRKDGSSYIKNMPKTAAGFRSIPIPPPLKKILSVYMDTLTIANPYLFTQQKTGRLHTKSSYTKMTARIRLALNAAAGGLNRVNPVTHRREIAINMIDGLTDHTFRHNYATRLHAAGVPVKSAQYLLGHESVETTLKIYTHLDRGSISHDMIDRVFDDTSDDTAAVKTS